MHNNIMSNKFAFAFTCTIERVRTPLHWASTCSPTVLPFIQTNTQTNTHSHTHTHTHTRIRTHTRARIRIRTRARICIRNTHSARCDTQANMDYEQFTMCYVLCAMYYLLCTMYYVLCTMCYVLCTMYYVLCAMYKLPVSRSRLRYDGTYQDTQIHRYLDIYIYIYIHRYQLCAVIKQADKQMSR
jgi:hypothetical protein